MGDNILIDKEYSIFQKYLFICIHLNDSMFYSMFPKWDREQYMDYYNS